MSSEFITIKVDADYKEKHKQKKDGVFEGECLITMSDRSLKEKSFFEVFPRGMFLGYNHKNGTPYVKGLIECCINQLYGAVMALDKTTIEFSGRKTKDDVDIEYLHLLREMSQLLVWISNSTSWRDGRFHEFDSMDIDAKLKHLRGMCLFHEKEETNSSSEEE